MDQQTDLCVPLRVSDVAVGQSVLTADTGQQSLVDLPYWNYWWRMMSRSPRAQIEEKLLGDRLM